MEKKSKDNTNWRYSQIEHVRHLNEEQQNDWTSPYMVTSNYSTNVLESWAIVRSKMGRLSWIPSEIDYVLLYDLPDGKSSSSSASSFCSTALHEMVKVLPKDFITLLKENSVPFRECIVTTKHKHIYWSSFPEGEREAAEAEGEAEETFVHAKYWFLPDLEMDLTTKPYRILERKTKTVLV
jgi:hypothetical protein